MSFSVVISIHALLAESDREPTALRTPHHRFLSTLSLRRATPKTRRASRQQPISIHALLTESDHDMKMWMIRASKNFYPRSPYGERHKRRKSSDNSRNNFYPRSPYGERLVHALKLTNAVLFLSTLSLRRATAKSTPEGAIRRFLSTLSLRRATSMMPSMGAILISFLSTLSLRRATRQHSEPDGG